MTLKTGSGRFSLAIPDGHAVDAIPVWYHLPEGLPSDSRIVVVLHGTSRAAEASRDNWSRPADENRFIVLVPDFDTCCFGGQPKLTDMVEVRLVEPLSVDFSFNRRKIGGTLRVHQDLKKIEDLTGVFYELEADYVD